MYISFAEEAIKKDAASADEASRRGDVEAVARFSRLIAKRSERITQVAILKAKKISEVTFLERVNDACNLLKTCK